MSRIEFTQITGIQKIGGGSQAKIYMIPPGSISKTNAFVLKKYKNNKYFSGNEAAMESYLEELISIKESVPNNVRKILDQYTTWPKKIIYENGMACGYIMHLIPDMFFSSIRIPMKGLEKFESNLDFILHGSDFRASNNLTRITDKGMAVIVHSLLQVVSVLHNENIILGDFSTKNVLIYVDDQQQIKNRVLLIDIDSLKIIGNVHPLGQLHSPGWIPPECQSAFAELKNLPIDSDQVTKKSIENRANLQNRATDVYKICLAIMRLYHEGKSPSSQYASDSAKEKLKKISDEFSHKIFSGLSDDPNRRPSIDILYDSLRKAIAGKKRRGSATNK